MWDIFITAHTDKETRSDIEAHFNVSYLDEMETILNTLGIDWEILNSKE